jgi:hypothetical protein
MRIGSKPEIYTAVHKGWRNPLFQMSVKAGKMNFTEQTSLDAFHDEFESFVAGIRLHHHSDDTIQRT